MTNMIILTTIVFLAIPLNEVYDAGWFGRFALLILFIAFYLLGRKLVQTGSTLL